MKKQIKIEKSEYSKVIERRDAWLLAQDKVLEHKDFRSIVLKSCLSDFPQKRPSEMTLKEYRALRDWFKEKFHKYKFMIERLRGLEENDPFGFKEIAPRITKANPYHISPTTLKSLLEDIRKRQAA